MTAVATSHGADQLGDAVALTDGYSAAFAGAAGLALVGALLAAATLRTPRAPAADAVESREEITRTGARRGAAHRRPAGRECFGTP